MSYTLDKVGNWAKFYNNGTDDERTHNAVNETTGRTVGGTAKTPSWDNTGCMTDDGENYKYVFDFRNRLVEAKRRGDNSLLARYSYDGLNRRIRKIIFDTDGTTETSDTRFLYSGWRCVEERDENDSHELRARYIYGGLYIDEPLRMYRDTDSDGDFADAGDMNVYYLQDRLFNVVALTDTDGAIKERTWYEPYGKPTNRRESDGDETASSHFGNPMLFCGYRFDPESGLYQVRNRYLNPPLGRWMTRDPIGYEGGPSLYEYVKSMPVHSLDPGGTVVVAFKGWEGFLGHYSSAVIDGVIRKTEFDQPSASFEYNRKGLEAAEKFIWRVSRTRTNKSRCAEPVYIVGYSIGARTAAVLSQRLAALLKGRPDTPSGWGFSLRMVILLDYNWGANTFDPDRQIPPIKFDFSQPLFPEYPHKVAEQVAQKFHIVSSDRQNHTKAVYAEWKAEKERRLGPRWGRLVTYFQERGLANTSGAYAQDQDKAGLNVGIWGTYSGDHLQMGEDEGLGYNVVGRMISEDYGSN